MSFLEQGERLVWQSKAGGTAGYNQLVVIAAFLVIFFGGSSLCTTPMIFMTVQDMGVVEIFRGVVSSLVCIVPMFGLIAVWAIPRVRPSFFLTDRALVQRKLFGGYERFPLNEIAAAERYVAVYQGRYGPRQVVTHRLAVVLRSGTGNRQVLFGPTKDVDHLLELLHNGVLRDWVDLSMLPAVDGSPAPAESRGDFFVCARSSDDGFDYGPVFIGPRRIVRFTESLGGDVLGRLYTTLGRATGPGDAEQAVAEILRNPATGHYLELPREGTATTLDGDRLTLRGPETTHNVELAPRDAERLRGFLTLSRRAPDGR